MAQKKQIVLPQTKRYLETMGRQIQLARKRRKLTASLVAERANVSRQTLLNAENGSESVSMGAYAAILHAIDGMDKDLLLIAKEDKLGRELQDMRL